jgi:leucyl-tRNA synthetase
MKAFDWRQLEAKWRAFWDERRIYRTLETPRHKYYCLVMFAYPSGDIHMGHFRNYTIGDVVARYRMMSGRDVLHPFGWDAFGQPAEAAAIRHGIHPRDWTLRNIEAGRRTLKRMAISYDWDREILTCDPSYYRWTQWIFLRMLERDLAYRAPALVNWCEQCQTILANEQAQGGVCWRCDGAVLKRWLDNCWFFRISRYAERLLRDLDRLEGWPESTVRMQREWIGRSEGCDIVFDVEGDEPLTVFTTRPDTLWGVTFVTIGPEHPRATGIARGTGQERAVADYVQRALRKSHAERTAAAEKSGVFTGRHAVHPFTGERIPIFVADYVLAGYGTGAVMGVPAHDQRDFEFARAFGLPVRVVIQPPGAGLDPATMERAYADRGIMVRSGPFDGTPSEEGIRKVAEYCRANGRGGPAVRYRLRDWLISRQRYWGCPIPVIHCASCGAVPVPERDLPVRLPEDVTEFLPKGRSPLADSPSFRSAPCPKCGATAERDPDTMDTFVDSSFYLFRYLDPHNDSEPWTDRQARKWLPVDLYIGGDEHACGHLLYFRFMTKVLHDAGLLPVDEPVVRLFHQGMVLDEKGEVMSKSKGNVVSPVRILDEHGVDVCRVAMLMAGPSDAEIRWSEQTITGARRFLDRIAQFVATHAPFVREKRRGEVAYHVLPPDWREAHRRMQQLVRHATDNLEGRFAFNTTIARAQEFLNFVRPMEPMRPQDSAQRAALREMLDDLVRVLAPFAPFLAEELWETIGNRPSVFKAGWPAFDPKIARPEEIELPVQVDGKVRARIVVRPDSPPGEIEAAALEAARAHLSGPPERVIVVPGRLVSVVTRRSG